MQNQHKRVAIAFIIVLVVTFGIVIFQSQADASEGDAPCTEVITVVDKEAFTEEVVHPAVPAVTDRVNHVWTGGPVDGPPPVDSDFWNPNNGQHNGVPHQQPDGVPYQVGQGNGDWFLWKTVTVVEEIPSRTELIEHPAVTHEETVEVDCPEVPEEPEVPVKTEKPADPVKVDKPKIEVPDEPGEVVTYQSFDGDGTLLEQRVSAPIPPTAQQEGM